MDKSETTVEIAKALCVVQKNLLHAKKDSTNPFFKAQYSSLSSVWDACRDLLADNGLSVVQTSTVIEGRALVVDTTLLHTSGEWITGELAMPLAKDDPQGVGSAMTYARRYGLAAIVGVSPEDDDAEGATKREPKPTQKAPEKPPVDQQTYKLTLDLPWVAEAIKAKSWKNKDLISHIAERYQVTGTTVKEVLTRMNELQQYDLQKFLGGGDDEV